MRRDVELTTFPRATTLRKVEGLREEAPEVEVSSTSSSASKAAACRMESDNWANSSIASTESIDCKDEEEDDNTVGSNWEMDRFNGKPVMREIDLWIRIDSGEERSRRKKRKWGYCCCFVRSLAGMATMSGKTEQISLFLIF